MNVGFSVLTSGSAVEIRCFGCDPSVADGMVSLFQCADGAAVLMGRLYYRADLIGALGDKATAEQHRSHAALAWAAYERWDHPGMARLEGDYCLVIWDRRRNRFIATRDPLGRFPLFWSKDSKAIAVSTSFAALPASGSRTLDLDYVADYLTRPLLGIQEPPSESCVWKQIRRVVPGEALIVDLNAGSALRRPYWNWLEQMVEPPSDRTEEIADDFAHRVRQAVMERSHGTTGAHLSGGVDSTAVAVLAQETLRSRPTPSSLHTFSLIYEHLATLCGETGYIDAALHVLPDAVAHRICADTLLTYDALRVEPDCDEPFADLLDLSRDQAILDAAASSGVTTLLTGHGGDDVFDVPPYHIADLLHSGAIRAAWREADLWSNAFDGNSWRALYRYGLAPLMPVRLRAGLGAALAGGAVGWQQQGLGTLAPWLARPFAREYHLYERGLKQLRNVHASGLTVGLDFALAVLQAHVGNARGWALAIPRGVFLAHPLTDPRILGLGLGIRLRYRQAPGTHKPLLTLAMRDVLPAAIRQRHSKCHFNEVHYRGLAHNLANLEELIQTSRAGEMGLFDCGVLTECLRRASLGDDVSPQGALQLDLALSLIKWLALQERLATTPLAAGATFRQTRSVDGSEACAPLAGSVPYQLAPDVVLVPVDDGSARLLDLDGGFFVLSSMAREMLEDSLADDPEQVVQRLAAKYGAAEERIRADLQALLAELWRRDLIAGGGKALSARRVRRLLAKALAWLPLRLLHSFAWTGTVGSSALMIFARLCMSLFGWSATVHAWSSRFPSEKAGPSLAARELTAQVDRGVRRAAAKLPFVACKERALCCWYLLNSRGIEATLIIGIQLYPLAGHCWCQVGGHILADLPDYCAQYAPVVRYGSLGSGAASPHHRAREIG